MINNKYYYSFSTSVTELCFSCLFLQPANVPLTSYTTSACLPARRPVTACTTCLPSSVIKSAILDAAVLLARTSRITSVSRLKTASVTISSRSIATRRSCRLGAKNGERIVCCWRELWGNCWWSRVGIVAKNGGIVEENCGNCWRELCGNCWK